MTCHLNLPIISWVLNAHCSRPTHRFWFSSFPVMFPLFWSLFPPVPSWLFSCCCNCCCVCENSCKSCGCIAANTVTPSGRPWFVCISPSCGTDTVSTVGCWNPCSGNCIGMLWNFGAAWIWFGFSTWIWTVCWASPGSSPGIVIGSMNVCTCDKLVVWFWGDCVWKLVEPLTERTNCTLPSAPDTKLTTCRIKSETKREKIWKYTV